MPVTMKSLGIDMLSIDDRMSLVEEIWDSIIADPESLPLTEAQKQDLQARLDADQETGSSWEEVRARLRSQK